MALTVQSPFLVQILDVSKAMNKNPGVRATVVILCRRTDDGAVVVLFAPLIMSTMCACDDR